MNSPMFQLNKVRRLINTQGQQFEFKKVSLDEYGEPNGQTESVTFKGVFHETTSYQSKTSADSTTIRQKSAPMIICLWDVVEFLKHVDVLEFNKLLYRINGIKNVCEANIIAEISLEEVQKG